MKSCPKCKSVYYDETLEFCMEDGSKLVQSARNLTETPTVITNKIKNPAEKTLELPKTHAPLADFANDPDLTKNAETKLNTKFDEKITNFKEKISYQGLKAIEILPIILALANNYWQWLYLNRANYADTFSFLLSVNFIVWFSLLILGAISCFIALKYGKNKGFAITAMVILAIDLLLSIVPLK